MSKIKIEQKFVSNYVPIVLWWDDVIEIFEVLQSNAKAVELETSKYKFTTLDVAKEHLGAAPQYDVKICAVSPYVNLDSQNLYVGAGPGAAQIFLEIDAILKKRERRPRWVYGNWPIVPVLLLGLTSFMSIDVITRSALITLQVTFVGLYGCASYISRKKALVVYARKRSEMSGFIQRNSDQIIMLIITAVLSGLLGFAGSQIKDKYFPSSSAPQK